MFPSKTPEFPHLAGRKQQSLRLRLALLVAGACLPFILFAGGLVYYNYSKDREAAFERTLDTVRSTRTLLDAKIQGLVTALEVLAGSHALQTMDLDSFRPVADRFIESFPGSIIALGDRKGTHLFNSNMAAGVPLQPRVNIESIEEVFRTGKPAFSNLFTGLVSKRKLVSISVPVQRDGAVIADLSFSVPLPFFQDLISQQAPPDWTLSITDRTGRIFARVPNPDIWVGQMASAGFLPILLTVPEGTRDTVSLDNVLLLTAWTRSPLTGWMLVGGTPATTLTAPLWTTLAATLLIAALLLSIGLAFAIGMAARIARSEALLTLMVNELNHRVKNTLATVQSIASQTFRSGTDPAEQTRRFDERLRALGNVYNVLSEERWANADLRAVVHDALAPFSASGAHRVLLSGPEIRLSPRTALMVSLVLHELATNAMKYGALSSETGIVSVGWNPIENDRMQLVWRESGGPAIKPPSRKGFGTRLIEQGFPAQLGGKATLDYLPEGLVCTLECPRSPDAGEN